MNKIAIGNQLTLDWAARNEKGRRIALACTKFQTREKVLNGGQCRSFIFLSDINAFTEWGKEGLLQVKLCDILGHPPGSAEMEEMAPALRTWWGKYHQVVRSSITETMLPKGEIRLMVKATDRMGFCESVIDLVSGLSIPLGLTDVRWFKDALTIDRKTFVREPNGSWVQIQDHWTSVHSMTPAS